MTLSTKIANRAGRLRARAWRTRPYVSAEPVVVIGGSPRSGTTLLRTILDAHPRLCCGPESSIFLPGAPPIETLARGYGLEADAIAAMVRESPSQAAFIEAFARSYRARVGKPRWAEKTPLNVWHVDWIWEHFPEARFIHAIRDGRDVVCSMRRHPDRVWRDGVRVDVVRQEPLRRTIGRWVTSTGKGLRHRGDPRYREIRYEELVTRPREVLADLFGWLGEPFEPTSVSAWEDRGTAVRRGEEWDAKGAIETSSVGRWRRDLTADEKAILSRYATPRLVALGYVAGPDR